MYLIIGLLAGVFGGLVGIGGGAVMIPLLVGLIKVEQHKAHGASLFALVFTGITGMLVYQRYDSVNMGAAAVLAVTAVLTVRFGVKYAAALPGWQLKKAFGGLLCFVAVMLPLKTVLTASLFSLGLVGSGVVLSLAGALTGFLSGMMGIGGGVIMVPALALLVGFDQHTAQGTSLLAMVPIGAVAAYEHWRLDLVCKKALPYLVPGIIVGSIIGGNLAHHLPDFTLKLVFAAVLLWTGFKFITTPKPPLK